MSALFAIVLATYFLFMLALMIGWKRALAIPLPDMGSIRFISVIIPFRNEESGMEKLIRSLKEIQYPQDHFEIIFVDDHSTDNSLSQLKSLISGSVNFLVIESKGEGKKMALTTGIDNAKGDIIVTVDADCLIPEDLLVLTNRAFQEEGIQITFGGVVLMAGSSLFSKWQSIEFISLMGSAVATIGWGVFTMCNGANLAFRKSAFYTVGGYQGNESIPSGDDEFLARKILKRFPRSMRFINSKSAVVQTVPASTLGQFIDQRLRWAGKWRYNESISTRWLAIFVVIVQISYLAMMVGLIMGSIDLKLGISFAGIKFLLDSVFLIRVSKFLGASWSWFVCATMQFVYPFYVLGIGMSSLRSGYEWKGRRLSHKM